MKRFGYYIRRASQKVMFNDCGSIYELIIRTQAKEKNKVARVSSRNIWRFCTSSCPNTQPMYPSPSPPVQPCYAGCRKVKPLIFLPKWVLSTSGQGKCVTRVLLWKHTKLKVEFRSVHIANKFSILRYLLTALDYAIVHLSTHVSFVFVSDLFLHPSSIVAQVTGLNLAHFPRNQRT